SARLSSGFMFSSRVTSVSKMFMVTLRAAPAGVTCWSSVGMRASSAKIRSPPRRGHWNCCCAMAVPASARMETPESAAIARLRPMVSPLGFEFAVPPMLERVGMKDALDRVGADARQARAFDLPVDIAQARDRFAHGREGEVGAPEDLVALGDAIFL